jgi:hypothetical protein
MTYCRELSPHGCIESVALIRSIQYNLSDAARRFIPANVHSSEARLDSELHDALL